MNDAELSRTILKDLGIIQERERKVEVMGTSRCYGSVSQMTAKMML